MRETGYRPAPLALVKKDGEIDSIRLKNADHKYELLYGGVVVKGETYGKEQFYTVQVTNQGINVYDRQNELVNAYVNPNIQSVLYMDDAYLYCLANSV